MIPAWIEASKEADIPTGLGVDESLKRALGLRDGLRGALSAASFPVDAESVETFHALCTLLDQPGSDPKVLLADASAAFEFISTVDWPSDEFGGRDDLLSRFAFLCWRLAREGENASAEQNWVKRHLLVASAGCSFALEEILTIPIQVRRHQAGDLLHDAGRLLHLCEFLWQLGESDPERVRDEAVFFYSLLERSRPINEIRGWESHFLGELALIAGGACRILSRRDEARRWFERAEPNLALGHNAGAHTARLAYQRLALRLEERDFDSILELTPPLIKCFSLLNLHEDALKCRFLEATVLKESERLEEAKQRLLQILQEARSRRFNRLAGMASAILFQLHAFLGELDDASRTAQEAVPVLRRLNNRVTLAKMQLGMAYLLRSRDRRQDSIAAFRDAQTQFRDLKMLADVAAIHLVIADLLLEFGDAAQAEREIHAALPVIDDLKLVPEGVAALTLLKGSLRLRQIDRQALRDLRQYFPNPKGLGAPAP